MSNVEVKIDGKVALRLVAHSTGVTVKCGKLKQNFDSAADALDVVDDCLASWKKLVDERIEEEDELLLDLYASMRFAVILGKSVFYAYDVQSLHEEDEDNSITLIKLGSSKKKVMTIKDLHGKMIRLGGYVDRDCEKYALESCYKCGLVFDGRAHSNSVQDACDVSRCPGCKSVFTGCFYAFVQKGSLIIDKGCAGKCRQLNEPLIWRLDSKS